MEKIDINEILKDALFNDIEIEQPAPVITIDNKVIATLQNFICISGLPKSRKTTFVNYLIGAGLSGKSIFNMSVNINKNDKVILVDKLNYLNMQLKAKNCPIISALICFVNTNQIQF